ncbi:MAG TPA: cupin domain-containing protein [Spirochaetota bacterium]|nr:cupin domain-containing protein [Spirochaetota bacterium]HOD14081.1 cupin domain-containing protein [Spirochaetota bacterium]HPG51777.1 cupin domain-containing protein [Spirochaetota bacterium]HPN11474.1 cupin domain-containing protein [Spirochaetota bacterium]HQL84079.1 cupin domain-containing protein [Spirochaetota bacterium]
MENTNSIDEYTREGLELEGLVTYQPGSVVSRTVINRPAGTVTLFAFDKGESLSEHTAPFDALVSVLDGTAEISIAGKSHTLARGGMIVMPAGKPHALRAVEKFKMMLVMIKG